MLIEKPVEPNLDEWFCKIDLGGTQSGMNNLDKKSIRKAEQNLWRLCYGQDEEGDT